MFKLLTRSLAVAREEAVQLIQFLLQYWSSTLSKVDIFFIWKNVYATFY